MIRAWLGIALLAASWLTGLDYYQPASPLVWATLVLLGTVLLGGGEVRLPRRRLCVATLVLLLPSLAMTPWPYKVAPLLMAAGLALVLTPIPRGWPARLGRSAIVAGAILAVQSLTIWIYAWQTARSHDLPGPIGMLLGAIARGLGADVAVNGGTLAVFAAGKVHRLGATWDWLVDPATLGFLVGGLVWLAIARPTAPGERRSWARWLRPAGTLAVVIAAWLPLRAALVLGLLLQRTLRADAGFPLAVMNQFASWWLPTLLLVGPVLLAAAFVRWRQVPAEETDGTSSEESEAATAQVNISSRRFAAACGLVAVGIACWAAVWAWDPIGSPKAGRVMVVERHSQWEPTMNPYDEKSYGEATSYTYRLIYDYAARFFAMSRLLESDRIDGETLARCDVLVVKISTARFSPDEVQAVERFVRGGGGLLLVGDHTNVFRSSTYLNDIARRFGFAFRNDLLFYVGEPYEQPYRRPWAAHPSVQNLGELDFAVSCSIDPGRSLGTAAIQNGGLWSIPARYNIGNYHPPAEYRADMRCGPFIQLWATRHGKGRVLAFTDSTIFSNFCVFQPGKAELMLGMFQWLNHRSPWDDRWAWLAVVVPATLLGLVLTAAGVRLARRERAAWIILLAVVWFALTASVSVVVAMASHGMPALTPERDGIDVVIDRSLSDVPLSKGAYTRGDGEGFGLLEQWIPRLGYFTSRRRGLHVFSGDVLVVTCPTGSVSQGYRERLVEFVGDGGRLLVLDSPENSASTANSLLWPFGLGMNHAAAAQGELTAAEGATGIKTDGACGVTGGQPLARIGDVPVAARAAYKKGSITAIGFGSVFNDAGMGEQWMQEPDAAMRKRYDLLFSLLRGVAEGLGGK